MTKQQELAELHALRNELAERERLQGELEKRRTQAESQKEDLLRTDEPRVPIERPCKSLRRVAIWLRGIFGVIALVYFLYNSADMFLDAENGILNAFDPVGQIIAFALGIGYPLIMGAFTPYYFFLNIIPCALLWLFSLMWDWNYLPALKATGILAAAEILFSLLVLAPLHWYTKRVEKQNYEKACEDYKIKKARLRVENEAKYADRLNEMKQSLCLLEQEISACEERIGAATVLHADYKKPAIIDSLIQYMEHGMADSLKEALLIKYNKDQKDASDAAMFGAMLDMQRLDQELAEQRRFAEQREQWERERAQVDREKELIEQQKRTADEMERIRKNMEQN